MTPPSKTPAYSRRYDKLRRHGYLMQVDGTVTRRQLAALQAIGYSLTHLAGEIGRTQQSLSETFLRNAPAHRSTVKAIDELYRRLHATPAIGPAADRVRARAARLGYPSSLAWDDIYDLSESRGRFAATAKNLGGFCRNGLHPSSDMKTKADGKQYCPACRDAANARRREARKTKEKAA